MNKIIVCLLLASLVCSAYGNPLPQPGNLGLQDGNGSADDAGNHTRNQTSDNLGDKAAELIGVNTADAGDSAADLQGIEDVKNASRKTFGTFFPALIGGSIGDAYGKIISDTLGEIIGGSFLTLTDTVKTTFGDGVTGLL